VLARPSLREAAPSPTVLEAACGSANDYRRLDSCGIAPLIDYSGFDLCEKNIANARALFPKARFQTGNVFSIDAVEKSFDLLFLHDLLEHLSVQGIEVAVREVCRVTRQAMCVGFFQMHEFPEHRVRPFEDYHWNTLSMERMRNLFRQQGFEAQVIHVSTFLRQQWGCDYTHNPNAYTFILRAAEGI
jgi:SAM-dependent methyltransferase